MKNNLKEISMKEKRKPNKSHDNFDPDGSWTGVPKDKNEKPIQDADDL